MKPKLNWRNGVFLGLTAAAIGVELLHSFDGDGNTNAWTEFIVAYVPPEIAALAIAGLSGWLVVHFGTRYYKKYKDGQNAD